jgi:hypothetical protein
LVSFGVFFCFGFLFFLPFFFGYPSHFGWDDMLKKKDGGSGLDKASEKLLKDFFKKGNSLEKRWRSFNAFREAKEGELVKFYEDNFHVVFTLLQDAVTDFSAQCLKGKRDGKYMDEIIILLQTIVQHLKELIGRQWQTKALADIIRNLLYKQNKLDLRLRGLDIYMAYLTAVKLREGDWAELKDIISMFGQCLLFQPYAGGANVNFAFYPLEAPNDVAVWLPGGTVTESDAEALFKRAFDFISKQSGEVFSVWLRVLNQNLFSVIFPKVCEQIGILPANQNTGFTECPSKLLRIVVTAVEGWMNDPKKVSLMWGDARNAPLFLELYSQGMGVSVADADISIKVLNLFYKLFFSDNTLPEISSRLGAYRVFYLKRLAGVFSKPSDSNLQAHVKLCQETIRVVRRCAKAKELEKSAIDLILVIPLTGLTNVVKNSALGSEVIRELALVAVKQWVVIQPETSWKPLETVMQLTFGVSMQAIEAAQEVVMQMSLVLQKFYYPSHAVKESKRKLGAAGEATKSHFSRSPDYRPLKDVPEMDEELAALEWTAKSSLQIWLNLRNLFSGLNGVSDPQKHCRLAEAIVNVADHLVYLEAGIPSEALARPDQPRPLELLDVFGPLLCETLEAGDELNAGKAVAIGGFCRLLCRRGDRIPLVVLEYVYSVLARELEKSPTSPPSCAIIANCGPLFALCLPGGMGLIPYFLHAVKLILGQLGETEVPDMCVRNCVTVICSLICFPSQFPDLSLAVSFPNFALKLTKGTNVLTAPDLQNHVAELLAIALGKVSKAEHVFMVICGLTASIMNDCRAHTHTTRVQENFTKIIQFCSAEDVDVAQGALRCIGDLAMDVKSIMAFDKSLVQVVILGLSNVIMEQLTSAASDKKYQLRVPAVVSAFEALEEWALAVPGPIVSNPGVNKALFTAIEMGIFGVVGAGGKKKGKEASLANLYQTGNPTHGAKQVAQVAEVLLRSMLNLHAQWPGPGGPDLTGTVLKEGKEEDEPSVYYFANGSVVSLVPLAEDQKAVRMIIRDESDRFAWNAKAVFDDSTVEKSLVPLPEAAIMSSTSGVSLSGHRSKVNRGPREPPAWKEGEVVEGVDKVDELLKYLGEVYDDCHYENDNINVADEIKPLVEQTAGLMEKQEVAMGAAAMDKAAMEPLALPAAVEVSDSHHWARLLLSHFNMVDYDQRAMFSMLESGAPLQRSINTLDTKRAREAFKIGVIYVRKGQDTQEQIMRNDSRSQFFDAFIRSLAWEVHTAAHRGYIGGLDTTKFLTGTSAPYYSTPRLELMYHDITCMPTDEKDDQQIHKKRHIGNDVVNVVFSEHTRDYHPATISTQFNCAHIIVYPLTNGLYRIQVCRKEEQVFPLFGPILHNMCVTAEILPLLVRQTSLNANRNFTSHKAGYLMPFPNRSKDVVQLLGRYKTDDNADYSATVQSAFNVKEKK